MRFVQSPDYIYGRYKLRGSDAVHEDFFPVISGPDRSEWLDDYCAPTFWKDIHADGLTLPPFKCRRFWRGIPATY